MKNINWIGALIVLIGVCASISISTYYGYTLANGWQGILLAFIGFVAVLYELIGYHRIAHLCRERRYIAMGMCALGMALAIPIGVTFDLGFIAVVQEASADRNGVAIDARSDLKTEKRRLEAQIEKAGEVRPLKTVETEKTSMEGGGLFRSTKGCSRAFSEEAKKFCEHYGAVSVEYGSIAGVIAAQGDIRRINAELAGGVATGTADPRASYVSQLTGVSQKTARVGIAAFIMLFLRICTAVAPFVFLDAKPATATVKVESDIKLERISFDNDALNEAFALARKKGSMNGNHSPSREVHQPSPPFSNWLLEGPDPDDFDMAAAMEDLRSDGRPALDPLTDLPEALESDEITHQAYHHAVRFAKDWLILTQNPKDEECAQDIQEAYKLWAEMKGLVAFGPSKIGAALTDLMRASSGGKERRNKSNRWHYFGCRLTPAASHRLYQHVESQEKKPEPAEKLASKKGTQRLVTVRA